MNFSRQQANFRRVVSGDSFELVLDIDPMFALTENTVVNMQVRPDGDIPQAPILTFSTSDGSITIQGQKVKFTRSAAEMKVRPGKYQYDCLFTREGETTTLFGGLFEIINQSTSTN